MKIPGLRFGETRSGVAICAYDVADPTEISSLLQDYGDEEHFDAWALFEHFLRRELRHPDYQTNDFVRFQLWSSIHKDAMSSSVRRGQMDALSLANIFALVQYGKSRADHFFRD